MSGPTRSILITFNSDEFTSGNDFAGRLAELRSRHPRWHVRGIVLPHDVPFVPKKPTLRQGQLSTLESEQKLNTSVEGGGGDGTDAAVQQYVQGLLLAKEVRYASFHRTNALSDNASGVSSENFENSDDERLGGIQVGSVVKLLSGPYESQEAVIEEIVSPYRVKVSITEKGGLTWWCAAEDVSCVRSKPKCPNEGEMVTSLSTMKERDWQMKKIRVLENIVGCLLERYPHVEDREAVFEGITMEDDAERKYAREVLSLLQSKSENVDTTPHTQCE
eukprot:PhF_6_TR38134/c0_g1_i1/m.56946